ncbi:hypothetical protein NDU88_003882 [Pleurodeles waltl]|uniref:Uncharacterized protein n=1 Tax=Pleurodeles waltl TaxID=8319 RepID=A0AAV7PJG1_PLEWA|nr:hypothetical protein NDU88_003882 [Pleurodeles waltl]
MRLVGSKLGPDGLPPSVVLGLDHAKTRAPGLNLCTITYMCEQQKKEMAGTEYGAAYSALRPEALTDTLFDKAVRDGQVQYIKANWETSTTSRCDCEAMKVVIRGLCVQTTYGVRRHLEKDVLDHEAMLRDLEKCLLTQPQRKEEWRQARQVLLEDW